MYLFKLFLSAFAASRGGGGSASCVLVSILAQLRVKWTIFSMFNMYRPQFLLQNFFFFNIFLGDFWGIFSLFSVQYSALLHLPPLRFHCADGCWDRTQDRCNWCIGGQTL
jgi:hypothetical protein